MIWVGIITFIATGLSYLVGVFNQTVFTIPDTVFSGVSQFIDVLFYLFPVAQLVPILVISLTFHVIRAVVCVIRFIKGFIPTMGG